MSQRSILPERTVEKANWDSAVGVFLGEIKLQATDKDVLEESEGENALPDDSFVGDFRAIGFGENLLESL